MTRDMDVIRTLLLRQEGRYRGPAFTTMDRPI